MSSGSPRLTPGKVYPLLTDPPKEDNKKDWAWISAVVVAVIGALIAGLGYSCYTGSLPIELLGGTLPAMVTMGVGLTIATPPAVYLVHQWLNPKD